MGSPADTVNIYRLFDDIEGPEEDPTIAASERPSPFSLTPIIRALSIAVTCGIVLTLRPPTSLLLVASTVVAIGYWSVLWSIDTFGRAQGKIVAAIPGIDVGLLALVAALWPAALPVCAIIALTIIVAETSDRRPNRPALLGLTFAGVFLGATTMATTMLDVTGMLLAFGVVIVGGVATASAFLKRHHAESSLTSRHRERRFEKASLIWSRRIAEARNFDGAKSIAARAIHKTLRIECFTLILATVKGPRVVAAISHGWSDDELDEVVQTVEDRQAVRAGCRWIELSRMHGAWVTGDSDNEGMAMLLCLPLAVAEGYDTVERESVEQFIRQIALALEMQWHRDLTKRSLSRDPLTLLISRKAFLNRVMQEVPRTRRRQGSFSLVYLHLNGLTKVNRDLGFSTGDELLRLVARSLTSRSREVDTIARYRGSSFAILMPDTSTTGAQTAVGRMVRNLTQDVEQWREDALPDISAIITGFSSEDDIREVLKQADHALNSLKLIQEPTIRLLERQPGSVSEAVS